MDNRYQSPLHLADDIERYLADEAVTAFPEPLIARTRRWVRKHQTLSATTAAIVLVSIIGLSIFSTIVSRKNAALNKANLALDKKNNELDAKNEELVESYKRESDARVLAQRNEEAARQQSQLALSTLASVINDLDTGLRNLAGSHDLRQRLLKTSLEKLEDVAEPFVAQTAIDRNTINALNQLGDVVSELAGNRPFAAPNLTAAPFAFGAGLRRTISPNVLHPSV